MVTDYPDKDIMDNIEFNVNTNIVAPDVRSHVHVKVCCRILLQCDFLLLLGGCFCVLSISRSKCSIFFRLCNGSIVSEAAVDYFATHGSNAMQGYKWGDNVDPLLACLQEPQEKFDVLFLSDLGLPHLHIMLFPFTMSSKNARASRNVHCELMSSPVLIFPSFASSFQSQPTS